MIGIDLFAGAGGMSLGARQSGVDVQVVIEADKYAAATYLLNHRPKIEFFNDDIRNFQKVEIDERNKQPLVLFGGPPCQGFSTSNQKTRTRENANNWLFTEFLRLIKLYMPEWVVFENVKGILETEGGLFAKYVVRELKQLGYNTEETVLNAVNYGVPQRRDRYFIVASLDNKNYSFPAPIKLETVTVEQALAQLPSLENGASTSFQNYKKTQVKSEYAKTMRQELKGCLNNLVSRNAAFVVERYKHVPQGGNWEDIPASLMTNYKDRTRCHTGIYRRLKASEPSVVIGNFRKNMLIHPLEDRGLSVREAARLQSFPDNFTFAGSIGFQQQQVGNAVPPLLAQAIFQSIKEAI